jgi:hypothetical protein
MYEESYYANWFGRQQRDFYRLHLLSARACELPANDIGLLPLRPINQTPDRTRVPIGCL